MKNWEAIKTAYKVASLGTVSAAAEDLGVHRATVLRHINALEDAIGKRLFIRQASGYRPTAIGKDLLQVAKITDEQFNQLSTRIRGQLSALTGELIINSEEFISPYIMPAIAAFKQQHPNIKTHYSTQENAMQLAYGEAHIAIRAGIKPASADNVVEPFHSYEVGLFASPKYLSKHGKPETVDDLKNHHFVGRYHDAKGAFEKWLKQKVPEQNYVLLGSSPLVLHLAIIEGIGIGFFPLYKLEQYPELIEVIPRKKQWQAPLWIVTHKDLYQTEKVQAFLSCLNNLS